MMVNMAAQEQDQNRTENAEDPTIQRTAPQKREEEKTLFEWKAPSRPFHPRDRQFWTTTITLAFIFGALLYIIEGLMPVFVVIAFLFLYYVLTNVKPNEIEYKITNYGIRYADKLTEWPLMIRFWFAQRGDSYLLVVDTVNLPGRLELMIDPSHQTSIKKVMEDYLPEEEASPSGMERAADWLSRKLPESKKTSA